MGRFLLPQLGILQREVGDLGVTEAQWAGLWSPWHQPGSEAGYKCWGAAHTLGVASPGTGRKEPEAVCVCVHGCVHILSSSHCTRAQASR